MKSNTKIFTKEDVATKVTRLAYQILEDFYNENEIHLIGIKGGGEKLIELLEKAILVIQNTIKIEKHSIELNKKNPLSDKIILDKDPSVLKNKVVVLVDDVSNSGKTLYYALSPLLSTNIKTIKVAVLIDRKHKKYPIHCDYVGNSLNTTIKEHISVEFSKSEIEGIYLN